MLGRQTLQIGTSRSFSMYTSFLVYTTYLLPFFDFNILNIGYSPKFVLAKLLRFGHLQTCISSNFFDIAHPQS